MLLTLNLSGVSDALCVAVLVVLLVPLARGIVAAAALVAPDESAVAEPKGRAVPHASGRLIKFEVWGVRFKVAFTWFQ